MDRHFENGVIRYDPSLKDQSLFGQKDSVGNFQIQPRGGHLHQGRSYVDEHMEQRTV
jgi:hypothetical protein